MRFGKFRLTLTFLAGATAATIFFGAAGPVGSKAATNYDDLSLFTNVLDLVRKSYVEPVDEHKLVEGAIRGMLAELDPHSSYLDPEAHKEMQIDTKGEFYGLGIEISKRQDGFVEVVSPIEGTPAAKAGIKPHDQIVSICPDKLPQGWTDPCKLTKTMTLFDAVKLMRGPRGSKITVNIFREGFDRPQPFTVVRDVVKVVSVDGRLLEPGYGYVRLRAFQERTDQDLHAQLDKLREESKGELHGVVLDLRDNPGGLLDQAVRVADTWLSDGLIVYTRGRVESQRQEFRARPDGTEPGYPLVVIVNGGSASASEIVAGALQDQGRAMVVGTHTFGKGSVQTVYPLEDGSGLRLTTALYYTPSGRSIQEVGISPDITVDAAPQVAAAGDAQEGPHRIRERDLEHHFTQEDAKPEAPARPLDEGGDAGEGTAASGDLQLARALDVLKSWTYFERLRSGPKTAAVENPEAPAQ
ncbi:MAG TPA: S41 family peptidase [Myxococcota bacterium]|nr:S41 family peptidase [Myxococcota bacterium]